MKPALANINLNLLRALHVLLEERSVKRAAERLFVSQPAMSKSLSRLRVLLDDPLLHRSAQGLIATPRAEALIAPLRATFEQLESFLLPSSFDPATVESLLRIAAPEQFALGVLPQLLACVRDGAPGVGIDSLHLMDGYLELLATGTLDFAIDLDRPYPEQFIAHPLPSIVPMIWFRRGHPLAKKKNIDLTDFCSYPQINFHHQNVTVQGFREVTEYLASAGLKRKVMLNTSHLLLAIDTLVNSDAVMGAPDYIFRPAIFRDEIIQRPFKKIPILDHLDTKLSLIQHVRTQNSPLHKWIVSKLQGAFKNKRARARNTTTKKRSATR